MLKENNKVDDASRQTDERKNVISPVIFHNKSNDIRINATILTNAPIEYTDIANNFLSELCEKMDQDYVDKMKREDYYTFTNFIANQKDIMIYQMKSYIIQHSFMNFCLAIDGSKYCELSKYVPLKEYVRNELEGSCSVFIDNLVNNLIWRMEEKDKQGYITSEQYQLNSALQLCQMIYGSICYGCDKAINDVFLQVHNVPNLKEILKCIDTEVESYGKRRYLNDFKGDNYYNTLVLLSLKNQIRSIIDDCAPCIEKGVVDIILGILSSNEPIIVAMGMFAKMLRNKRHDRGLNDDIDPVEF